MCAIIPARGNSKRLPGKNALPFHGVPLVVRAIQVAREAAIFNDVIVSSENYDILQMAEAAGAEAMFRHSFLSDDTVQTASVVFDVLCRKFYRHHGFCLLLPTSPLRTPGQIRDLWREWKDQDIDCLMTMVKGEGLAFPPRHDGTALFAKTLPFLAALDFWRMSRREVYLKPERAVDINTREDFERAETLYHG